LENQELLFELRLARTRIAMLEEKVAEHEIANDF
jgi:hypothetical protein